MAKSVIVGIMKESGDVYSVAIDGEKADEAWDRMKQEYPIISLLLHSKWKQEIFAKETKELIEKILKDLGYTE
jgi:hypothetical protein